MKHVEASTAIFFTNEHARFKMLDRNRQLNNGKINRIIKEINKGNDQEKAFVDLLSQITINKIFSHAKDSSQVSPVQR